MEKVRYVMKPKIKYLIANSMTQRELAQKVGVTTSYMNEIITSNKRRNGVNERLAYFICKAIDPELEIADIFDKAKE